MEEKILNRKKKGLRFKKGKKIITLILLKIS